MSKYKHLETIHNLNDPMAIVPLIMNLLSPNCVVDIGCGLGTFLYVFKQYGVRDILGIDGTWVDKKLLYKYLKPEEFQEWNLEEEIKLNKKYDLVISLEVAEHLPEKSAEIFIQNLVNSGNVILFSAAIPLQGGQNHINEQWLTYWEKIFVKFDYVIHDVIRSLVWDNPKIHWWYKQNMVLVTPKGFKFSSKMVYCPMRNIVHYDLFTIKSQQLENIIIGRSEVE